MRTNKRNIIFLAGVLVVASFIGWFVYQQNQGYSGPIEQATVSLKWLHQTQFAGFYVAKEKGFYLDNGLVVEIIEWDFIRRQEDDLASGVHEFAVLNPIEMLEAIDKGLDFRAVAVIYQHPAYALIASK